MVDYSAFRGGHPRVETPKFYFDNTLHITGKFYDRVDDTKELGTDKSDGPRQFIEEVLEEMFDK